MIVTNGTVEVSRQVKPADYENKGAKVSLSFAVEDGEDIAAVVEQVGAMAHDKMLAMLRRPETLYGRSPGMDGIAQQRAENAAKTPPKAAEVPAPQPDPIVQAVSSETTGENASASTVSAGTDTSNSEGASQSPAPEITDEVIKATINAARARNVSPDQIKAEIAKHVEKPGMSVYSLGPQKRALVRVALEALQPAAA